MAIGHLVARADATRWLRGQHLVRQRRALVETRQRLAQALARERRGARRLAALAARTPPAGDWSRWPAARIWTRVRAYEAEIVAMRTRLHVLGLEQAIKAIAP